MPNLQAPATSSSSDYSTSPDSTVFFPGARSGPESLIFASQDSIRFYIDSSIFSGAAKHAFRPILSAPLSDPRYKTTIIHVPETSEVLNIVFHAIYNISCLKHSPSFDSVITTIGRMSAYDINTKHYMGPSRPLHELLLHFMPRHPLEVYVVGAHYDVYSIAEAASAHLLSYPINTISDEMATRMGAVYLKRLLSLHENRFKALKYTVMAPPTFHVPTGSCTYSDQGKLSNAWMLAAACLVWEARPDLSARRIEEAFLPLQDLVMCPECYQIFSTRVRDAAHDWSSVKSTI